MIIHLDVIINNGEAECIIDSDDRIIRRVPGYPVSRIEAFEYGIYYILTSYPNTTEIHIPSEVAINRMKPGSKVQPGWLRNPQTDFEIQIASWSRKIDFRLD